MWDQQMPELVCGPGGLLPSKEEEESFSASLGHEIVLSEVRARKCYWKCIHALLR